jgi:hypothetical protein
MTVTKLLRPLHKPRRSMAERKLAGHWLGHWLQAIAWHETVVDLASNFTRTATKCLRAKGCCVPIRRIGRAPAGPLQAVRKDDGISAASCTTFWLQRVAKATTMGSSNTWKTNQDLIWRLPFTTEESGPRNTGRFTRKTGSASARDLKP